MAVLGGGWGNDGVSPSCGGSEDAVIGQQIGARTGDLRDETLQLSSLVQHLTVLARGSKRTALVPSANGWGSRSTTLPSSLNESRSWTKGGRKM